MVKDAMVTDESVIPDFMAMALMTLVEETVMAELYVFPALDEGVAPSVVYLIVAPLVAHVIVTLCAVVNVPPAGVITGAETACGVTAFLVTLHVPLTVVPSVS